ncbi:unnamed protein product [Lota lota]
MSDRGEGGDSSLPAAETETPLFPCASFGPPAAPPLAASSSSHVLLGSHRALLLTSSSSAVPPSTKRLHLSKPCWARPRPSCAERSFMIVAATNDSGSGEEKSEGRSSSCSYSSPLTPPARSLAPKSAVCVLPVEGAEQPLASDAAIRAAADAVVVTVTGAEGGMARTCAVGELKWSRRRRSRARVKSQRRQRQQAWTRLRRDRGVTWWKVLLVNFN